MGRGTSKILYQSTVLVPTHAATKDILDNVFIIIKTFNL